MTQDDAIMTIKEVSVYLRLAESTVYKLAQEGQLPGRKIGGAWRFSRKGLERWIMKATLSSGNDTQEALITSNSHS